jgi:hypothetical protein
MNFYCPKKSYKRKTHLGKNSFFTLQERSVESLRRKPSSKSRFVELGVNISFNHSASVIHKGKFLGKAGRVSMGEGFS